ncbi:MAG TPA: sigma-54 dependent transcriptional regulator [Candidatus Cloacimonadota bacterium]|nr:sigma-54 dependent transcriptional regulator [Candidatus Cloacimonadota bacterium]
MRILVIDDEPMVRKSIANFLTFNMGHQVLVADNADEALLLYQKNKFDIIISDIRMPGIDGIELIKRIKQYPEGFFTDIILITGHANLDYAMRAIRVGAYDFLKKPLDVEQLALVIERIIEHQNLLRENYELTKKFDEKMQSACRDINDKFNSLKTAFARLVGIGNVGFHSSIMQEMVHLCNRLHENPSIPVLIQGETGVGKEVIARLVHYGEGENAEPFISLNCSAISETLFESELFGYEGGAFTGSDKKGRIGKMEMAQNGTLFLDEIGEMPLSMQPKLLKVIEEHEFYRVGGVKKVFLNARIICATNSNLTDAILDHTFRSDLYYRINTANIKIPPLRERTDDILPLAELFLQESAANRQGTLKFLNSSAKQFLIEYNWPGNIRQLKNAIQRVDFIYEDIELTPQHFAFLDSSNITNYNKPSQLFSYAFTEEPIDLYQVQRAFVKHALAIFDNNKTRTANYLGISINKLRRIIQEM